MKYINHKNSVRSKTMKNLKDIIESQNFLVNKKLKNRQREYKYQPKDKNDLADIIIDLLKQDETDLNCIDVSNVTDMSRLFSWINNYIIVKDIDISEWDVSNVTNMHSMFYGCTEFNSDLSNWDVSNVTDMGFMFYNCKEFNSDISKWDVFNVITMAVMFFGCKKFNSDLSKWDVSKVKTMKDTFTGCTTLKKNNKIPDWYK